MKYASPHRLLHYVAIAAILLLSPVAAVEQEPNAANWQALYTQAGELYIQGDLPQAIAIARSALRMAATPSESGKSLDRLGFLLYTAGNGAEGEKLLREALRIQEAAFGDESLDYAETANDLALVLRDNRMIAEAKALAARSVAIRLRLLGPNDPLLGQSLNTEASIFGIGGEYAAAVPRFEQAVAIHESFPPSARSTEEYGTLCVNLASTYQRLGRYESAQAAFKKGLDVLRVKPGVDHPAYAVSVLAYASLEVDLGRFAEAERAFEEGGRLLRATLSDEHPLYATFLNNRGFLFQSLGNTAASEADYRQSLVLKRKLGQSTASVASTLRNLAHVTYARDPVSGALAFAEAAEAYARLPNAPPFEYVSVLLGQARAQRARQAYTDARATLERAISVARQGLSVRHPLFAAAVRDLGLIDMDGGDDRGAERNLTEAVAIAEDAHGKTHPSLADFLEALAGFHVKRGDFVRALPLYRRSADIRERFLDDVMEIGSERFKATSMTTGVDSIPQLIAFQDLAGSGLPPARVLAFEVVSHRKGRVLDQVRSWRQQVRQNATPAVLQQMSTWQAILQCRTSLTVALGYRDVKPSIVGTCGLEGTDLAGRYRQLLSDLRTAQTDELKTQAVTAIGLLGERADALETALNRETGELGDRGDRLSLDGLRRQLGRDEVLIEFIAYESAAADRRGRRYGAFLVDSDGRLDWTDIGPAPPIDAAVRDLLAAANDWSISVRNRESRAARSSEVTARDALAELSARVCLPLKPLVDARPGTRQLRIAPDGSLNLVPFEALSDPRELVDHFAITYLPAGRDLMMTQAHLGGSSPIVVVSPGANGRRGSVDASGAHPFRAGGLAHLAAAAGEAADFKRQVPGAEIYRVSDATERQLKNVRGPRLLHVVGHGVIVAGDNCVSAPCAPGGLDRAADAMTLSAIVLEEAYGRAQGSPEDGMLTALELQNIDLRGTEMLVLSQCHMANGVASFGDGVYGMRRAASIAGARTFVAPLWNVEDAVQRRLMKSFYTHLSEGETRGRALWRAKLAVRSAPSTSSFLYWAPVILSGSADALPHSLFESARR